MKITRTGVGTATHAASVRDSEGSSMLPIQAVGDGVTNFRVLGRVSLDAPWVEIKAGGVDDFLESFSWVPYLQLEIVSGAGTVTLYIGEK